MNFTLDASKTQAAATTTTEAAPTTAVPNFSFGGGGAGDATKRLSSGFSLMSAPNQAKPGGLFNSPSTIMPTQSTGLTFGVPSSTSIAVTGSTFGSPSVKPASGLTFAASPTPSTGMTFGTTNTTANTGFPAATLTGSTPGFSLGGSTVTAATTTSTTGLTFETPKLATTGGFSLGGAKPTQATGLTFGTPSTATSGIGFSLSTAPSVTTAAQTGFSLAPTTATPQPDSTFGTSTATTTASTGFTLGGTGTTAASTGFSFGTGTTSTTLGATSLYKTTTSTTPSSLATSSTQVSLGTTTTVTSSAAGSQPMAINFFQLEESINKWTLELEEQEKVFVNQATQINAWDKLLISNGEKIVTLNQEVERVKIEQQQLEHELDYVVSQQKELQDCLAPLEKELASLSVSDPEREYTYRLAENLDTQLKQMSEDLKEIIEHLNEANRTQDSSDPIVQIGKILNAHMNSLQWLDQQTALLSQKIQQIDQMHQNFRQENERNFNLAYN